MFSLDVMANKICTNVPNRFNAYALNMIPTDIYNYLGWLLSDEDITFKTDDILTWIDIFTKSLTPPKL